MIERLNLPRNKSISILLVFFLIVHVQSKTYAQDPFFTQSFATPLYANPALTGSKDLLRISYDTRYQWVSAMSKLNTNSISADMSFERLGVGFSAMFDKRSVAFTNSNVGISAAYQFGNIKKFIIRPGVKIDFQHRGMDWDDLIFIDQLTPQSGLIVNNSQAYQESANINIFDMSAGVVSQIPINVHAPQPNWIDLGFSMQHINKNDLSYIGITENIYPQRYTLHGGYLMHLNRKDSSKVKHQTKIKLYPNFKIERYAGNGVSELRLMASRTWAVVGVGTRMNTMFFMPRNTTQILGMVGFEFNYGRYISSMLSYSIDWGVGGLNNSIATKFMTHEISLNILFSPRRKKDCPENLKNTERWFDNDKLQRRFENECPPGRSPRMHSSTMLPIYYPYSLPAYN